MILEICFYFVLEVGGEVVGWGICVDFDWVWGLCVCGWVFEGVI